MLWHVLGIDKSIQPVTAVPEAFQKRHEDNMTVGWKRIDADNKCIIQRRQKRRQNE